MSAEPFSVEPVTDEPVTEDPAEGVYARRTRLRRREILRSASREFAAKGFYQASLADVAGAAGITAAGLLHHFKTKEALLVELLQLRDAESLEAAPGEGQPEGLALLQHLVDTAARNSDMPGTTQLYAVLSAEAVTRDHPAQAWFRRRYADLRRLIEEALRSAADAGDVATDVDAPRAAAAIIAAMDGLQLQWLYAPEEIDMAAELAAAITTLVRPRRPLCVPAARS